MSDRPRLFCLDTVLVDVILKVDALPERAGDVLARETLITTGGGFNAMSAATRHGASVTYAGRMGTGPFATIANGELDNERIDRPIEKNIDLDNGLCIVLSETDGERSFVTSPGAEGTLRMEDLERLSVKPGDYVLVSGYNIMYEGQADFVLSWLESLDGDVHIVFDPATRMVDIPKQNVDRVLRIASWLDCNADEASKLTSSDDVLEAASKMTHINGRLNALVRDGENGCVVGLHDEAPERVDGFNADVVDTNGAGDVHNGVFIAELIGGASPSDAARWANAASAMAIGQLGGASCPARAKVEAFINAH